MPRGAFVETMGGRKRRDRGASLVEFALIAPILFLLLFGTIEFGRAVATFNSVNTAAREGARYGTAVGESSSLAGVSRFLDCEGIRDAARARVPLLSLSDGDIVIEYDKGPGEAPYAGCQGALPLPTDGTVATGDRIVVAVTQDFESPVPIISNFLGTLEIESRQARTIFRAVLDE
jgi:hypothetical protein